MPVKFLCWKTRKINDNEWLYCFTLAKTSFHFSAISALVMLTWIPGLVLLSAGLSSGDCFLKLNGRKELAGDCPGEEPSGLRDAVARPGCAGNVQISAIATSNDNCFIKSAFISLLTLRNLSISLRICSTLKSLA